MGFRPPIVGTRLRVADDGEWLDGDVDVRAGVGTTLTRQPSGVITVDSVGTAGTQPKSLFVPGALAVGELIRLVNRGDAAGLGAYLTSADVAHGTAPVAADATDHKRIRIAGSTAGSYDLAIASTDRYHRYDAVDTVPVASWDHSSGAWSLRKVLVKFTPTATFSVQSVSMKFRRGASDVIDATRRYAILNADRSEVLAATDPWTDLLTDSFAKYPQSLTSTVELQQSTEYWVAFEFLETSDKSISSPFGSMNSGTENALTVSPGDAWYTFGYDDLDAALPSGGWTQHNDLWGPPFYFSGLAGGVLLTGPELIVSCLDTGTGGTAGEDTNINLYVEGLE